MTVLVTGGAGFVGAHVVRELLGGGHDVVVLDAVTESPALDKVLPGWRDETGLQVLRGTINAPFELVRAVRGHDVDRVVHLASPLTADAQSDLHGAVETICQGTANVFEAAAVLGVRRVVWTSSISVFGPTASHPRGPLGDDTCHRPNSLYGACKSLCEHLAQHYRDERGLDSVGLRLTIVYGPARSRGITSFVSEAVDRAASGQPVTVRNADQRLNWQYVTDVATVIARALDAGALPRIVYNTAGDARSIRDAAEILRKLLPDCDVTVEPGLLDQSGGLLDFPADFDDGNLRRDLGFEPAFPLERGLAAAVAAARAGLAELEVGTRALP